MIVELEVHATTKIGLGKKAIPSMIVELEVHATTKIGLGKTAISSMIVEPSKATQSMIEGLNPVESTVIQSERTLKHSSLSGIRTDPLPPLDADRALVLF
jgi:hypothetical protein